MNPPRLAALVCLGAAALTAQAQTEVTAVLAGHALLPHDTTVAAPRDAGAFFATAGKFTAPNRLRTETIGAIPANTFVGDPKHPRASGGALPVRGQSVQGFSAIVSLGGDRFLAMTDNGFGSRINSQDALLMVHRLKVDWATGRVQREHTTFLRDPQRRIPFAIQNEATRERYLTGADLDIESLQQVGDEWWIGDEFGPYVIRFDAQGRALGLIETQVGDRTYRSPDHYLQGRLPNYPGEAGGTPGAPPATTGGAVSVLADPRTNALLIRAPNAARLAAIRAVIAKLDQPPTGAEATGNIRVVYLKNADATRLATVLRAAFSAGGSGGGAGASGGLSGAGGLGSSTAASGGGLGTMAGQNGSNGASTQSTSPVNAAASPSTGGFIQADPATNALIITAPEPMYRQLRAVIDQLDARRAQVYVESMIVKIDANKTAEFGFQWQGLLGKNGDKYGLVAGTNYGATGNIVNLSTTTTSSLSATTTASSLLGNGLNVGLIQAVNGVYTLGALARFLESEAGANVLSTPNLVALDNEEAKIVIGQNVPFVTGSFTGTGSSSNSTNPFQTIERKDVGLTLRLKPQIGENGTVRMQVYQENSSVVSTSTTSGPTTDKSAIETTVVVDDGQIMVLGGLLKDEFGDGEDRVPGLASLPLVGNLFKSGSRKRVKTNLLVFLRPVVMRTQADATALTLDRYEAIRARQQTSQPTPSATLGNINDAPVLPALPERPAATLPEPTAPAAPRPPASSNGSLP